MPAQYRTFRHDAEGGVWESPHETWSRLLVACVKPYVRRSLSDAVYNARTFLKKDHKTLSDLMRTIKLDETKEVAALQSKSCANLSDTVEMFLQTWIHKLFVDKCLVPPLPEVTPPNALSTWRLLRICIDEHLCHCLGHLDESNAIVLGEDAFVAVCNQFLDRLRNTTKWWDSALDQPKFPQLNGHILVNDETEDAEGTEGTEEAYEAEGVEADDDESESDGNRVTPEDAGVDESSDFDE
jgi:hypothetical protein